MKEEIYVKLKPSRIKEFVEMTKLYPGSIDLSVDRHYVDAASVLGVYSLDLRKPVKVELLGDDDGEEFLAAIEPFRYRG
jgi:phosphotransferase system HPr-like phosphotransfer protein